MKFLTEKPYIWAHKGASGYLPENTLEAFELAAKMNADGVELDVGLTKDKRVVVIHDEKIDKVSNGQGAISMYTLDELKKFDFGYHFYNELRGYRIPTLEEVLELLAPTGLMINIELKVVPGPALPAACVEIVRKMGMEDRVIYSSFDHMQLMRAKAADPDALIAPLYHIMLANPWNYAKDIGAFAVHPQDRLIPQIDGYIDRCHEAGIRVHAWTTDDPDTIKYLLNNNCDAIITNYPDRAVQIRDEFLRTNA